MFVILPYRDHNPTRKKTFMNKSLIVINMAIFMLPLFLSMINDFGHFISAIHVARTEIPFTSIAIPHLVIQDGYYSALLKHDYSMIPARLLVEGDLLSVLSSMFLHDDLGHLLGNMLFLYVFGDNLEDVLGPFRYLLFYLLGGLCSSFLQTSSYFLFDNMSGLEYMHLGASGAISAVLGGYLVLFPRAKIDVFIWIFVFMWVIKLSAWFVLIYTVSFDFMAVYSGSHDVSNIAHWAHIGGFLSGLAIIFPVWLKLGGTKFWRMTGGKPNYPETIKGRKVARIPLVSR